MHFAGGKIIYWAAGSRVLENIISGAKSFRPIMQITLFRRKRPRQDVNELIRRIGPRYSGTSEFTPAVLNYYGATRSSEVAIRLWLSCFLE